MPSDKQVIAFATNLPVEAVEDDPWNVGRLLVCLAVRSGVSVRDYLLACRELMEIQGAVPTE